MRILFVVILGLTGCSDPDPKNPGPDASMAASDAAARDDVGGQMQRDLGGSGDATAEPDLPALPAYCATASTAGFFADCSACDANGLDCDSIDAPGASGRACGCSSGSCPCGLRCGEYEIAPNVTVSGICVR